MLHRPITREPLAGKISSDHLFFLVATVFALTIWVLFGMWDTGEFENLRWVYHDKMTTVYMHNWLNGEYKHCSNINANNHDKPFLMCDDAKLDEEPGKVFNVRFYGRTYQPELPFETTFDWSCKRGDGSDPMFVCKRQSSKEPKGTTEAQRWSRDKTVEAYFVRDPVTHKVEKRSFTLVQSIEFCKANPTLEIATPTNASANAFTICPAYVSEF